MDQVADGTDWTRQVWAAGNDLFVSGEQGSVPLSSSIQVSVVIDRPRQQVRMAVHDATRLVGAVTFVAAIPDTLAATFMQSMSNIPGAFKALGWNKGTYAGLTLDELQQTAVALIGHK